jgi:alpha-beta hydrolase superfamily lysophospholipase
VPPSVLRSWDEAEARLFPLVMAQPELYQQALGMVRQVIARLRETCPDLPALLAAHERGGDLVADLDDDTADAVPGIRPVLIASAACAMRYREIVALMAAQGRLAALARARAQGLSWAVLEERGQADRAPYVPYQRVEAQVDSGRAVVVSIGPDETLSRAVYRLEEGQVDVTSGALRIGDQIGSYLDPGEFEATLHRLRA